jgi:hypothetical protein
MQRAAGASEDTGGSPVAAGAATRRGAAEGSNETLRVTEGAERGTGVESALTRVSPGFDLKAMRKYLWHPGWKEQKMNR